MTNQILTRKQKNGEIENENIKKNKGSNQQFEQNSDYGFYEKQGHESKQSSNNIFTPAIFQSYLPQNIFSAKISPQSSNFEKFKPKTTENSFSPDLKIDSYRPRAIFNRELSTFQNKEINHKSIQNLNQDLQNIEEKNPNQTLEKIKVTKNRTKSNYLPKKKTRFEQNNYNSLYNEGQQKTEAEEDQFNPIENQSINIFQNGVKSMQQPQTGKFNHFKEYSESQKSFNSKNTNMINYKIDDLANQAKLLQFEQIELDKQREKVIQEKQKIQKQIERFERRHKLQKREDSVKRGRMILEIEKKKIREEIQELDKLKQQLNSIKGDTMTGFSDIAESNQELISVKSTKLQKNLEGGNPFSFIKNQSPYDNINVDQEQQNIINDQNNLLTQKRQKKIRHNKSGSRFLNSLPLDSIPQGDSPKSGGQESFISAAGIFDWAESLIINQVKTGAHDFIGVLNQETGVLPFTDKEIIKQIETLKSSRQSFEALKQIFQKALETLKQLMDQMNLKSMFQFIKTNYSQAITTDPENFEILHETTIKLLFRCKSMMQARLVSFKTLEDIMHFENKIQQISRLVDQVLEGGSDLKESLEQICIKELPMQLKQIQTGVVLMRDQYKLFNKLSATTSHGNQVTNVMAYKRRDVLKYIEREYRQTRLLLQVIDIDMPFN